MKAEFTKIINVVGARPNFMKMAPIVAEMNNHPDRIDHILVHTGQHYDQKMSKAFFDDLGLPKPDIDLGVGSGSHAEQTARIMVEFERVCRRERPDLVVVVGDVNSTMACTITAKKLGIAVAHVEAGLRSLDMNMPEEINRLCTDVLCDYLFTTDHFANENLKREGVPDEKIFFVGNVMIDTLLHHKNKASKLNICENMGIKPGHYATLTLHRPGNVDHPEIFAGLLKALSKIAEDFPIVFPIHPRAKKMAEQFGLMNYFNTKKQVEGLWITDPIGYLDFLHINIHAKMILTDSGGLQEEATVLGVPCLTIRPNTERPITCEIGTNVIIGNDPKRLKSEAEKILHGSGKKGTVPEKWDGKAAKRIVNILLSINA